MISTVLVYLGISLGINLFFFLFAAAFQTDKLTDITYGLTFMALSLTVFFSGEYSLARIMLLFMILAWAARLATYLFIRIQKIKKDNRFDKIRGNFVKFLGFWVLQGVSVWVVSLGFVLYLAGNPKWSNFGLIGLSIWTIGLVVETVADLQKYSFINNKKNKGKWIASGLWKYSRHPNYFGEILCWIGVYLYVFFGLGAWERVIAIISPLYIALLIIFVSGIPLLEKKADEQWGKAKGYQEYVQRTSVLIPLPLKTKR